MHIYIYTYIHIHMHIHMDLYIYIYMSISSSTMNMHISNTSPHLNECLCWLILYYSKGSHVHTVCVHMNVNKHT